MKFDSDIVPHLGDNFIMVGHMCSAVGTGIDARTLQKGDKGTPHGATLEAQMHSLLSYSKSETVTKARF